ncbi:glycosyltransferase family 1 protein [Zopfia rhizophila CBS 207.26]|uniref:Glycosyltransferase family 1 protein n=1 Tax=Zopfia rhizophila CBS 207.26 TaxID=1314779 RepID=A0A6A6DXN0_9PEZI|nr:glycosyltransferase family 1 protein [Zopfia rhizophila CBS 207.26]
MLEEQAAQLLEGQIAPCATWPNSRSKLGSVDHRSRPLDLNIDSSLCKTLAKCVPAATFESHVPDRTSNAFLHSRFAKRQSIYQQPRPSPTDIPALNIVVQVVGSRDDHGYRVCPATHDAFADFVRGSGLEFYPIGGYPAELMASMVKNPGLVPSVKSLKASDIQRKQEMAPFVANAIIANPPSFAYVHCAQALSIPVHPMFTMPWSNTRAFPHPLANVITKNSSIDPVVINYISYSVVEWMTWQGLGEIINNWRATIDLQPITGSEGPNLAKSLQIPFTYCWTPALVPKPADWPSYIDVCGFFFRSPPNYTLDPYLKAPLDNGPRLIYIGFGSIVIDDPDKLTNTLLGAVRATRIQAIISKGWSNLGANGQPQFQDENVLYLGDCPHEWLFQHVAAVIHHGGAGTTACGLLSGQLTFIVPFFGDGSQSAIWGHHGRGCRGRAYAYLPQLCLTPEALEAAQGLASEMRKESGVASAIQSFHNNLPTEKLACDLLPAEPAVWTYKSSKRVLKLSNLAAEILSDRLRIAQGKLKILVSHQRPHVDSKANKS